MSGHHVEFVFQLVKRDYGFHILRMRLVEIVVYRRICLSVQSRNENYYEHKHEALVMLRYEVRCFSEFRQYGPMPEPVYGLVENKNQRREYRYGRHNSQSNSFCHHKPYVPAYSKLHYTKCQKACDGCKRTSAN